MSSRKGLPSHGSTPADIIVNFPTPLQYLSFSCRLLCYSISTLLHAFHSVVLFCMSLSLFVGRKATIVWLGSGVVGWLVGWLLVLARYFPKCQLVELFVSSLIGKINELNLIALKHIIYCLFRLSVWPMGVPSSFNPSAHLEMAHYSIGWNNTGVFAIVCFTIKYYC